ncbi:MAG: phosphoenolpyruvate carboxykinase (GTP) [Spirochaetes bacterium]|nr:phosphoenolpyruvate carboxykinase (GTP) [Spirochaetota bacterium]
MEPDRVLKERLSASDFDKLAAVENEEVHRFIARYIALCDPASVFVATDSDEDISYVRRKAVEHGEESELALQGHTVHYDGYHDQARDKKNTRFLLPEGMSLGADINAVERKKGLSEMHEILTGIMSGHELFIRFFCLGPLNSEFSIPCVQLTDSAYVAHSEDLLYRKAYGLFKGMSKNEEFFRFVHSEGRLENSVSVDIEKRRIYIDLEGNTVYSTNTQYGGNTIGLKKLAMRLAIQKSSPEGWLTEHMFVMGVNGPNRRSYFSGAFPSLCGKTSTSMVEGETIVGDDIAYLRKKNGKVYGVNVEKGIFGIIQGVNQKDDALIWRALHSEGEIIFSNVLSVDDGGVYWIGKDDAPPERGINHCGEWTAGRRDAEGNEIDISHKNARFTLDMRLLSNRDPAMEDPEGVVISGMIYGGRDSDTWVPVEESFSWEHGIVTKGASLESETTAATLGQEGVRKFNPMSNLDFLSITVGRYIENNLEFGKGLSHPPKIFSVNYFLKDKSGNWLNEREDKRVWLKWMELRTHDDAGALRSPTGYIPLFEDLKRLFSDVLKKTYTEEDYVSQFTVRIPENLQKTERIIRIYRNDVADTPPVVIELLKEQKNRLAALRDARGEYISPFFL